MKIGIQERFETYMRLLKAIEVRMRDRQLAAIVFAELAADIRAGRVEELPERTDRTEPTEKVPEVVKLRPRIPR